MFLGSRSAALERRLSLPQGAAQARHSCCQVALAGGREDVRARDDPVLWSLEGEEAARIAANREANLLQILRVTKKNPNNAEGRVRCNCHCFPAAPRASQPCFSPPRAPAGPRLPRLPSLPNTRRRPRSRVG